jgi:DNA-binding response OmpR family regulator
MSRSFVSPKTWISCQDGSIDQTPDRSHHPQILIALPDTEIARLLEHRVLNPAGYAVIQAREWETVETLVKAGQADLLILGDALADCPQMSSLDLASNLLEAAPPCR